MTGTIIRREGGFALIEFDGLVAERWVVSSSFPKHLSDNDTSGRYSNDTERVLQQLSGPRASAFLSNPFVNLFVQVAVRS